MFSCVFCVFVRSTSLFYSDCISLCCRQSRNKNISQLNDNNDDDDVFDRTDSMVGGANGPENDNAVNV